MTGALALSDASRVYGQHPQVTALREVSLRIDQGEFVAIEGESGSGKSTLLNVLGLLDAPTSGSYDVNSRPVERLTRRELARSRSDTFAYIFQAFHILERRPVIDSVELPMLYRGVDARERRVRALDALSQVGIVDLAFSQGRNLSGGQRQRVAVARALAARAPVLLADEPTGNLDSENTESVMACLADAHRSGVTVVLVTHSTALAQRAQRRIQMRDGSITHDSGATADRSSSSPHPDGTAGKVRLRDALNDAWANVTSRVLRSVGLVAAVALSIALSVTTTGLAFAAQAQVTDAFNAAESTDVTVEWGELSDDTGDAASIVSRLEELNGVTAAALAEHHDSHAVRASPVRAALVVPTVTLEGELAAARLEVDWADSLLTSLKTGEVLVGDTLAAQLELPSLVTSPVIDVDGVPLAVVGIITSSPRAPEWLGGVVTGTSDDSFTDRTISVTALVSTATGAARQVSSESALAINPYDPKQLNVLPPADPNALRATIEGTVQTSLVVLTIVALLASLASVTLATLSAVGERRGEIGLRRALGAGHGHISSMLTFESTIIGMLGAAAGVVFGLAAILAVTISRQWTPIFDPLLAASAVAAGTGIGIVGALAGALRALQISPSEALRPGT